MTQDLPSAQDVAAALIEAHPGLDQMQLHKLLYLVQAAHLAWFREPAFAGRIEAWKYGPVARGVAGTYMQYDAHPIPEPKAGNSARLTDRARWLVGRIVEEYGSKPGGELAKLTKGPESPWRIVRGDLPGDAYCSDEIPADLMAQYHRRHGIVPVQVAPDERPLIGRVREGDKEALAELAERVTGVRPTVR